MCSSDSRPLRQELGYSLFETRTEKPIKHVLLARPSLVQGGLWKHLCPGASGLPGLSADPASPSGTESPEAEKERNSGAWGRELPGARNCPWQVQWTRRWTAQIWVRHWLMSYPRDQQRNVGRIKKTCNRRYWGGGTTWEREQNDWKHKESKRMATNEY